MSGSAQRLGWQLAEQVAVVLRELAEVAESPVEGDFRDRALGTAPIQVVRYAQRLFEEGDLRKGIRPKSFDQVYAVVDRDDHDSYFDAVNLAKSLDGKRRNDDRQPVTFKAIASIPSFELWLLLHYEDIQAPID